MFSGTSSHSNEELMSGSGPHVGNVDIKYIRLRSYLSPGKNIQTVRSSTKAQA